MSFTPYALLFLAFSLILSSCGNQSMSTTEAARWIEAYTPAHIDQDAEIRIELTNLTKNKIKTAKSLDKVLSFSPSVKGTTTLSPYLNTIYFRPENGFKQGTEYECRVDIGKLTGIDSVGYFSFKFFVNRREMKFDRVKVTVDPSNVSTMIVTGQIVYNSNAGDRITGDSTIISCDCHGARVHMDSKATQMSRGFRITGIERQDKDRILKLTLNPGGGFPTDEYNVTVPSTREFRLLDAERIEAAEPYINLEFSKPLSTLQDPAGLITTDRIDNVILERNGTNVKVRYPQTGLTDINLHISELLKDNEGENLGEEIELTFNQPVIPPAIELPFQGSILPDNHNLKLPFRAVNLAAVDVEVVKIFPSNIMAYLQEFDFDQPYELRRFGRLIYRQTVRLDDDKSLNLHRWQDFSVDLKGLFAQERGAVYNIRLTFRKKYSLYGKSEAEDFKIEGGVTGADTREWDEDRGYIQRNNPNADWSKYNWRETDDPTKESYYMVARMPETNLVASDLGLIVKRADEKEVIATVTHIPTAAPMKDIKVTAYNYQLQKIGTSVTDGNGFATFRTESRPFMVTATDGKSTTYLKVTNGNELSTSSFDVSGKIFTEGIKGFVYGERDVWRPGDDIHLALIIEDRNRGLPQNHPVVLELYNPMDQLFERQTIAAGTNGLYVFNIATDEKVPNGLWNAQFKVGNEIFRHPVRIETIKPNRLKIDILTPDVIIATQPQRIGLQSHWLSGPVAAGMSAAAEMEIFVNPAPFEKYKNFTFKNPLVDYSSTQRNLFSGNLDSLGTIAHDCTIGADMNAPGMLQANITAKITEPGGDASITSKSVPFSPFGVYVGVNLGNKDYQTDTQIKFPVVVVNRKGESMKTRELDYKIYRLDWDWWWEGKADDLSRYVQSTSANIVSMGTVTATNGSATIPFKVEYPEWGRYLIMVRDMKGGHATGGVVTVDWPEWRGRADRNNSIASTQLSFTLDKKEYEVGETANIYLPKCDGGRVLLSIENGTGVLKRMWVDTSAKSETKYQLAVDKSMAPNFYVSATLLRPHRKTDFETPMRLFGIRSASVIDTRSILHPVIDMPDELHPLSQFTVKISELDNKPMTYTLAVVDEGLLDVTGFRTPQPWSAMNRREALGVKTWDMYDDVIGAFGANFRPVLSVGGDEALRRAAGKEKRFNPVVKFIGPFTVKGGTKSHKLSLPNYVGSVRVMVVAAHNGSYGSADKTVKVTSPLMLLSTLPRTLACGDTVTMPVNLFSMADDIRNVSLSVVTEGPVSLQSAKTQNVTFKGKGEKMVDFRLVCDRYKTGKAKVIVKASGNGHIVTDTTFITVDNPMPGILETFGKTLAGNSSAVMTWSPVEKGFVSLQIASMPSLNFKGLSLFMEAYPHLCTEQLSSKALFMLYGRKFLDDTKRQQCERELPEIIKAIQSRQTSDGAFVYWPGGTTGNDWVTSMAGLVLAEADRQGFRIENSCREKWQHIQETKAREYRYSPETDLEQAFRLYSLAVAGFPHQSAMNRLHESKSLSRSAAFCLASTYYEAGRKDVAGKLIERAVKAQAVISSDWFHSVARDNAIELEAYALYGNTARALPVARKIAASCTAGNYVTQDIAFATIAMSRLADKIGTSTNSVVIKEPGRSALSVTGFKNLKEVVLNPLSGKVEIENRGNNTLELSLLTSHKPAPDTKIKPIANGVKLSVYYVDLNGKAINIENLKQDTEFKARITVTNLGDDVENMALTYAIPAGWEIWNNRVYGNGTVENDYTDIRDDAYKCYFPLESKKSRMFEIRLRAAYQGNYLLPPAVCEDMYNPLCRAVTANRRVNIGL